VTLALGVLASGRGSNLQAILDACASGVLPARVVAVISNRADAFGLERARRANVPTLYKPKLSTQTRYDYDSELGSFTEAAMSDFATSVRGLRARVGDEDPVDAGFLRHFLDSLLLEAEAYRISTRLGRYGAK